MTIDLDSIIGLGALAVGFIGIGYAIGAHKKMNDICDKIDKTIEEVSGDIKIDISETVVRKAVDKAVERDAEYEVKRATDQAVKDIEKDIKSQVQSAINSEYADLKKKVSDEMTEKVSKIDMSSLKADVREQAAEKILDKFDGNLDDILENFNNNLTSVQKIYSSIAKSMSKDDGKEMTFKIS